jgi:beta-phosphoglucomutase-like phosphatase (HAD superfamily)
MSPPEYDGTQNGAPGPRALLLDLDGVLWDTLPVMRAGWSAVREEHGVTLPFQGLPRPSRPPVPRHHAAARSLQRRSIA